METEKVDYEELAKALSELPDNDETRRKALLLREFLVNDEVSITRIADIENGIFSDTLNAAEALLAEKLFNNIKNEFQIDTQKDFMDLWMMIALFVRSKRFLRAKTEDLKQTKVLSSITKSFLDSYSSLGRELGISRQQRLVRRISRYDESGTVTELFAGIDQVEIPTPAKRIAKKKKKTEEEALTA